MDLPSRYRPLRPWAVGLSLGFLLGVPGCSVDVARPDRPVPGAVLAESEDLSVLVVGDDVSLGWPAALQQLLDERGSGGGIRVWNGAKEGADVEQWIAEPGSPQYERTFQAVLTDFLARGARLRGDAPRPGVALIQLSAEAIGGAPDGSDEKDPEAAAQALEVLALHLRDHGVERVFLGAPLPAGPVDGGPSGNGAVGRLLALGHEFLEAGPDGPALVEACSGTCVDPESGVPTESGTRAIAEAWYRVLAGAGG